LRRLLRWVDVVEWDAVTTGVGRDLEEAAEMLDIVERDAATTGVGRDLEGTAEMVRRSGAVWTKNPDFHAYMLYMDGH
jgi:hypothetical protein